MASFGLLQFGEDNKIDDSKTEFRRRRRRGATPPPTPVRLRSRRRATGGPLVIGTLLPLTGFLAFLGPPEVAGVQLAVQEINAAGGVLGAPVAAGRGRLG